MSNQHLPRAESGGPSEPELRERAERHLGSLVVAIEFTLISVMVGVILFPLMDFATDVIRNLEFEYMLYVVSGLILILYTWSEVISHSLTFIGWPMDMLHTLLYIASALFLGIQMHFLESPLAWFAMTTLSVIVAAAISRYDKQLLAERRARATGAAADLYATAYKRQEFLARLFPLSIIASAAQTALIYFLPTIFIENKAHLILVIIQILVFTNLTWRTLVAFKNSRHQILAKAMQDLSNE